MKFPQTIDEIRGYFKGLTFHEVDLSIIIGSFFISQYIYGPTRPNYPFNWMYRLAAVKTFFLQRTKRTFSSMKPIIPQADYIMVTTGVDRNDLLMLPVLEQLAHSSRLIIYTESTSLKESYTFPSIRLQDMPFSAKVWQQATSFLWKDIHSRLSVFQKDFGLNYYEVYCILSALCTSIATVLKAERLLEQARPKVVFTEADWYLNNAIILQVARRKDITSATLVHGIRGGDSFHSSLWSYLIADRLIVWGEWMRQDFIGLGIPKNKILVGGYPRLAPLSYKDRQAARDLLLAQTDEISKRVIVLVSSSLGRDKPAVELFMNAQNQSPDCYFMIRPHPQENLAWYETNLLDGLKRVQNPRHWTLANTLALADVVVGTNSTACIDALIIGKRLILIREGGFNYEDTPMLRDAIKRKVAFIAGNSDELAKLLREAPLGSIRDARSFAKECALCLGSEAAHLTGNLLHNICLD